MRKSAAKRIKITRTGKLLHRRPGQNHFNAKASRHTQLRHKKMAGFPKSLQKKIKAYL